MEKSMLGGNFKTYASKKGRTSNYRLSCMDFQQEIIFDQLVQDEEKKKPVLNKKSFLGKSVVNYTKNFPVPKPLQSIENQPRTARKPSLIPRPKNNDRRVRTKHLPRNKENSKYCSRLYKSNNSDSDVDLRGLSTYEIDVELDPLADYKKRRALKTKKTKPSRRPSVAKDFNAISCVSESESLVFRTVPATNINHSNSSVDIPDPTPVKSDEKVFKRPDFVETSSKLFYTKNSICKSRRRTKTQKKLSFGNTTLDDECDVNNASENADRLLRTVQSKVDEIFNSDTETQNDRCSVIFKPGIASTPNFDRKRSPVHENCEVNKIENEESLKQLEDTFISFRHLFSDHEQSGAVKYHSSEHSPVTRNEDVSKDEALDENIHVVMNESLKKSINEASNRSIHVTANERLNISKDNLCDPSIHVTLNEPLHTSKKDDLEKTAENFNYSSDSDVGSSPNDSRSSSMTSKNSDTNNEQSRTLSDSNDSNSSLSTSNRDKDDEQSKAEITRTLPDSSPRFSSDSNSSLSTSNRDTDDEQSKAEIISENSSLTKSRSTDSHSSLYTYPDNDRKLLENLNETSFNSNECKHKESNESIRNSSKNDSPSNCSEYQLSQDDRFSHSLSPIPEKVSVSSFAESQNFSRVRTAFSSSPISVVRIFEEHSIVRIFEEHYGTNDLEDQHNNSKTEFLHVTSTEPDLEGNSPLSKTPTRSTEDVLIENLSSMNITAEPEVKESSLTETTEFLSPIHAPIEPEIEKSSIIESIEHLSPIRSSIEPNVEKSSLIETSKHLSPIRALAEPEVEEPSLNVTAECSFIQAPAKNTSAVDAFVGWLSEEYYQAVKLKETLESICKELEPKYVQPEDEIPAHLKHVTRRRKKTFVMPTLNEENSNLEEDEEVDLYSKARNSPVHTQDMQRSHNQTSLCTSRLLERSSMLGHSLVLATGKKWRRSFITLKNIREYGFQSQTEHEDLKGRCWRKNVEELISSQFDENPDLKEIAEISSRTYSNETFFNQNCTYLEKCKRPSKARFSLCVNHKSPLPQQQQTSESSGLTSSSDSSKLLGDKSYFSFVGSEQDSKIENNYDLQAGDYSRSHKLSLECHDIRDHLSAKETVLRYCKQDEPLPFEECFNDRLLKNCKKIGEGVYGEVFMLKRNKAHCSVLKIIPIEGDLLINGEKQKKYDEIVSELVISRELSDLRKGKEYFTDNFAELQRCWCVYGKYPNRLIDLWDVYNDEKGSDNDSPKVFDENQLYIILELSHGGEDIESFEFNNAQQALSVFSQVAYALAVAEEAFNFEHRDLHWGNILVSKTKKERTKYVIGDFESTIRLRGVKVTIIDYTLSRITVNNCIVFNDIGQDPELFTAQGDFQFEVYRLMKNEVRDVWNQFIPKTNVYWLCYLLDKMIKEVRYRRISTQIHQKNLERLNEFFELILGFASCHELICHSYFKRTISAK